MEQTTLPTVAGDHCLSTEQVLELRKAVDELDAFMVESEDQRRRNLWVRPGTKDIVDFRVRALLRTVAHTFQVAPINEQIRVARTALLTRRVRVVMRAFNHNRRYATSIPPCIEWDDTFVPPDLYPTLPVIPEAPGNVTETTDNGKVKEAGEDRRARDKGKGKEKAGDEGKAKERQTDSTARKETTTTAPDRATKPKPKRKRKVVSPETVENSDEELDAAAEMTPPPAPARRRPVTKPRLTRKPAVPIPIADFGSPPPCTRCVLYNRTCIHNGWKSACRNCGEARQKCSLSKALPEGFPKDDAPSPVAGPSNPQPTVVKIVIPRVIPRANAPEPAPETAVPQAPGPPESERGLGVSPTAVDLPSRSYVPPSPHLPKDPPAASKTRRISAAVPAEPRIRKTTPTTQLHPDLHTIWERIRDQERRLREVEASDMAIRGVMVTNDKLKETDSQIRRTFQAVAEDLHCKTSRIEKKINACADDDVKAILGKLVDLGEQVEKVGEVLDGQDTTMREELQTAERRWERQLNEQEQRLEGRIEEQEIRFQDGQKDNAYKMQTLAVRLDDALLKMTEDIQRAPWERQLEEGAKLWRKELQDAMKNRPTTDELSAYTTLLTTEKIVEQLSKLQVRADEQYNGLQGGLTTLERLYLRQLDQTADMINVPQQLHQHLSTQQAQDQTRPPVLPHPPLFHQPPSDWAPAGRVVKGLPRRMRAMSGPPGTPTPSGPSTIPVTRPAEQEDVEMKDGGVAEDFSAVEADKTVQLPPQKRARSIPPKSSIPPQAHVPRRTRSQSRSAVPRRIPFLLPPPTIFESEAAPGNSSPLSEPDEVPGMSMSDILQDHVLNSS